MADKVIMDTNVAVKAATSPEQCPEEELGVQKACIEYIKAFTDNPHSKLVLDMGFEIEKEYRDRIPAKTNMGRIFWNWFNRYRARIDISDYVKLEKDSNGHFIDFPEDGRLEKFDLSDRKFPALSIAHSEHPPIMEATDGKWLGYQDIFKEYGVHIEFLDLAYAQMMYERKIPNK